MTIRFKRYELPIAYSMIAAAKRIRPRRDGSHPFEQYFLFWTAFNNIYTTIAHNKGLKIRYEEDNDGSILTIANGSVNIPKVVAPSESEQINLACEEFGDELKHTLLLHDGTKYFVERIPYWQGKPIEFDSFGQKLNGVINVTHTIDSRYPVWSPIDFHYYMHFMENPEVEEYRDFLVNQIMDLLFTVRKNLMHGGKDKLDDANDIKVVENAFPMLELIVLSFTR